ncbi:MAG: hypothetical protein IKK21_06450, partial [Clostridia bacterium]|nr:hypothetical protein [Clostridia bacterium]
ERNGRIKNEDKSGEVRFSGSIKKKEVLNVFQKLYRFRLKVNKGETPIANVSLLFALLALLISPHTIIIAGIASLALGYKLSFDKNDPAFAKENLEKMVRSASQNVKNSVGDMVRTFTSDDEPAEAPAAATEEKPAPSYYQSNPAATTYRTAYTGTAPTLQVPVQVETNDGSVTVEADQDGHTTVTIE